MRHKTIVKKIVIWVGAVLVKLLRSGLYNVAQLRNIERLKWPGL